MAARMFSWFPGFFWLAGTIFFFSCLRFGYGQSSNNQTFGIVQGGFAICHGFGLGTGTPGTCSANFGISSFAGAGVTLQQGQPIIYFTSTTAVIVKLATLNGQQAVLVGQQFHSYSTGGGGGGVSSVRSYLQVWLLYYDGSNALFTIIPGFYDDLIDFSIDWDTTTVGGIFGAPPSWLKGPSQNPPLLSVTHAGANSFTFNSSCYPQAVLAFVWNPCNIFNLTSPNAGITSGVGWHVQLDPNKIPGGGQKKNFAFVAYWDFNSPTATLEFVHGCDGVLLMVAFQRPESICVIPSLSVSGSSYVVPSGGVVFSSFVSDGLSDHIASVGDITWSTNTSLVNGALQLQNITSNGTYMVFSSTNIVGRLSTITASAACPGGTASVSNQEVLPTSVLVDITVVGCDAGSSSGRSLSAGSIAGISVGAIVGGALCALVAVFIYKLSVARHEANFMNNAKENLMAEYQAHE